MCNASGLEDSCWKGECDECKGGSKLKFSDKENNAEVTYHEWQDVTIQNCGKNRDKTYTSIERVTGTCHVGELKEIIYETFGGYQEHVRTKRTMQRSFEKDKADNTAYVIQIDYAMPYNAEWQDEIQAALWTRKSIQLMTAAIYDKTGNESSHIVVTDAKEKWKDSTYSFLHTLLAKIHVQEGDQLIIYSDGARSELKNKFLAGKYLALLSRYFGIAVLWKYFASGHGKGAVDGIGGGAKARVRAEVMKRDTIKKRLQLCAMQTSFSTCRQRYCLMLGHIWLQRKRSKI